MNKQNHRFLLIALCFSILFISLHTVANASTTADPYFSSVNTTLPSSRKIVEFDAQTINSCRTISHHFLHIIHTKRGRELGLQNFPPCPKRRMFITVLSIQPLWIIPHICLIGALIGFILSGMQMAIPMVDIPIVCPIKHSNIKTGYHSKMATRLFFFTIRLYANHMTAA